MNRPERTESAGKAAKIIDAARDAFFEQGYEAISMDEVARRAGVAKQTIYSYYPGKDALFLAVQERERACLDAALQVSPIATPEAARAQLREIGLALLERFLSPPLRPLLRVIVAAAHRFPSLGKEFYDGGVEPQLVKLGGMFQAAVAAGGLRAEDPWLAARHFIALVRGELWFHCLVDPSFEPSPAEKLRQVEQAVDCFLAKYGAPTAGS